MFKTAALKGISLSVRKRRGKKACIGAVESWSDRPPSRKKPRYLPNSPIKNGTPVISKSSCLFYFCYMFQS